MPASSAPAFALRTRETLPHEPHRSPLSSGSRRPGPSICAVNASAKRVFVSRLCGRCQHRRRVKPACRDDYRPSPLKPRIA
jgi:hypothetical protein